MNKLIDALDLGIPCVFQSLTGLYCPGCGGTRAVRSLLKGDLLMSFKYHPLVLYTIAALIIELIIYYYSRHFNKPMNHGKRVRILILVGTAIVVINWLFKDYMLVFRQVDLLPPLN